LISTPWGSHGDPLGAGLGRIVEGDWTIARTGLDEDEIVRMQQV
jgi:hypothetical protein